MPIPVALEPGAELRFPTRILLAQHRHAWIAMPGKVPDSDGTVEASTVPQHEPVAYVVLEAGPPPRVVVEHGGFRMLLYVDLRDAQQVFISPTRLCPNPDCGEPSSGLTLYPGFPTKVLETREGKGRVAIDTLELRATGWVAQNALGFLFAWHVAPPSAGGLVELRPGAALFDAPKGRLLAEIKPGALLAASVLAPSRSGFTQVLIRRNKRPAGEANSLAFEARGFVADSALGGPVGEIGEEPAGPMSGTYGGERSRVTVGTRLYDKPAGAIVGVAIRDTFVSLSPPSQTGWRKATVLTPWGPADTWVKDVR